ncbi:MAG: hypothetical protein B6244_03020 [Candidatus Cloacimonetes bacterium 4572_55]|nr:MAG: hypothetical protein B6244_03020 [Candidatus Cloacimonetes bacterium 4572_55]
MQHSRIDFLFLVAAFLSSIACQVFYPVPAYGYFGRNKVQYSEFDWEVMETPHFEIFYYKKERELVEIAAKLCEDSFADLTQKFKDHPYRKTPLIVYSTHFDFQQTNATPHIISEGLAGLTEFLKGRVVVHHNGSYYHLKHVIHHELTHVFMLARLSHALQDHKKVQFNLPPLWFVEGIAEYWSSEWNSEGEMIARDYALNGHIMNLRQMWRLRGYHVYKIGQLFFPFIAETYGEEKILMIMQNWWKANNFEQIITMTLGEPYEETNEKWVYWLKKRYYPIIKTADHVNFASQKLTVEGYADMKPAIIPNQNSVNDTIIFLSNRTGFANIYRIDTAQKEKKISTVVKGERTTDYESFHQFRSRIDVNFRRELAFVSKSGDRDRLYIRSLDENRNLKTLKFDNLTILSSPNWSPDGEQIVFNAIDEKGYSDLFIVNVQTEELERLTEDFYDDLTPAWSPLEPVIAFSSDRISKGREGCYNIFELDISTRALNQITFGDHKDMSPTWSGDGKRLAFASDRDQIFNLYVMETEKNKKHQLIYRKPKKATDFFSSAIDPVWSNDNQHLIFTAFNNTRFRLYRTETLIDSTQTEYVEKVGADIAWTPDPISQEEYSIVHKDYTPLFSIDIAQGLVGYDPDPAIGNSGMVLAMSDMLGDHLVLMTLSNSAQSKSDLLKNFSIGATYINRSSRINWGVGGFHYSGQFYDYGIEYSEWLVGVQALASYPFSKFRRVDFSSVLKYSDKDKLDAHHKGYFLTNYLSYVRDASLWGSVGPVDGSRYNMTVGISSNLSGKNTAYYLFMGDYRHYFRISRRSSYAVRLIGRYSGGEEAERFRMGGSWTLRGYPRNSLSGNYLLLLNNEVRFPIFHNVILNSPMGVMEFFMLRGGLFFDVGNTWDDRVELSDMKGSFGLGLRLNMFGAAALRWDFSRRVDFKKGRVSQKSYNEFFFGWNY